MDLRKSHEHPRIFDALLVLFVVVGLVIAVASFNAGGWWFVLGYFVLFCEAVLAYGIWVAPQRLTVERRVESLSLESQTRLRVVFLSDLHAGGFRPRSWFERIVRETQALKPDLILLGGDYVVDRAEPIGDLKILSELTAPLGRYFVLGNHDFLDRPQAIRQALQSYGFEDLTHRSVQLQRDGRSMELQGVDSHWFGRPRRFRRTAKEIPHLTLAHEPDVLLDLEEGDTDLVVVGHTHGGQVRFPFIGAIWPIPSQLGRRVDRGRKIVNGIRCLISDGLGETDSRFRLGAPPQILLIEIGI